MKSPRARTAKLLADYARQPSVACRNQLVELNAGLVRKVAHQLSQQCAEPYEDLLQTGFLGLIRAIERFDPQQNRAFSSLALPYIRGAMLHYLRDRASVVRLPRCWHELQARARRQQQELTVQLGRSPNEQELATALGISRVEWRQCQAATQNCQTLSLDATLQREEAEALTLGDLLPDRGSHWQEVELWLESALSQLEEKTRVAIDGVYRRDWSRRETAAAMGVSPMTVTRYLKKGLRQLSDLLAA